MQRWKKVLIWVASIIVVLGVGGLFAANYAVDKLMNSMATSFEDESVIDETTSSEVTEPPMATAENSEEPSQTVTPTETTGINNTEETVTSPPETPSPVTSSPTKQVTDKPASTTATNSGADNNNATNKPTGNEEKGNTTDGYTAQVSTEKAKEIQENVTVKDKANVTSIVLGELSLSDIKRLQELASGGLTLDEKREARQIILGKVSEDQYNELSQIAKKYGVSRGLSHDQIVAEEEEMQAIEKEQAQASGEGSE
ncbi:hypothetical protein [Paenibacillus tengchongensis]|uniref:hypothetical protein n=1 Tax=Paenibacillus tengchongensis TaxID=2608684 RepID=UPI00124D967A|nr:hypothetical protein [Paenibacillus tengchongensis]